MARRWPLALILVVLTVPFSIVGCLAAPGNEETTALSPFSQCPAVVGENCRSGIPSLEPVRDTPPGVDWVCIGTTIRSELLAFTLYRHVITGEHGVWYRISSQPESVHGIIAFAEGQDVVAFGLDGLPHKAFALLKDIPKSGEMRAYFSHLSTYVSDTQSIENQRLLWVRHDRGITPLVELKADAELLYFVVSSFAPTRDAFAIQRMSPVTYTIGPHEFRFNPEPLGSAGTPYGGPGAPASYCAS